MNSAAKWLGVRGVRTRDGRRVRITRIVESSPCSVRGVIEGDWHESSWWPGGEYVMCQPGQYDLIWPQPARKRFEQPTVKDYGVSAELFDDGSVLVRTALGLNFASGTQIPLSPKLMKKLVRQYIARQL